MPKPPTAAQVASCEASHPTATAPCVEPEVGEHRCRLEPEAVHDPPWHRCALCDFAWPSEPQLLDTPTAEAIAGAVVILGPIVEGSLVVMNEAATGYDPPAFMEGFVTELIRAAGHKQFALLCIPGDVGKVGVYGPAELADILQRATTAADDGRREPATAAFTALEQQQPPEGPIEDDGP